MWPAAAERWKLSWRRVRWRSSATTAAAVRILSGSRGSARPGVPCTRAARRRPRRTPPPLQSITEISSDGGTRSSRCVDDDLREMRLSLLMEIERRKQAEEALESWQNEWKKLSHHLSLVALSLPSPSIAEETSDSSMEPGAELCQQIIVSQLVSAAIASGFARAKVESDMETIIAAKNFEIARLSDRVQYYEAANREMSQRNQEAIEMSRQQWKIARRNKSGSGVQLGLQLPLARQPLLGPTCLHRSPKPLQNQIVPAATRARMQMQHLLSEA